MSEVTSKLSSSSSSTFVCERNWRYDVFLSFRGEDTCSGFTGHLYRALQKKGIRTFIDEGLERGEKITPALFKAIQESKIAVIIFSVDYASSSFCLDELVKILECKEQKNQFVLPIFYLVDPSDIRNLRGSYGEALASHKAKLNNTPEKIEKWKSALREAANISGCHFNERYEFKFIEKIVAQVSKRASRVRLHVADYPVGLEPKAQEVISLLDVESNEGVVMVGIHGIGGVGKSTIAREVHNVIADKFEDVCFLFNIREDSKHGLAKLQESLLCEITGKQERVDNVNRGIPIIRQRLHERKILLVLDDVDSGEQLKALAGGLDWFYHGSRIIIITRDEHLLNDNNVKIKYEVANLCHEDALKLFNWKAFKGNEVDPRYVDLSNRAVNYCDGLPLALEIIGSNLFGKSPNEWMSALDMYERSPEEKVQKILSESYNDLHVTEQMIFLDIACFFGGWDLPTVKDILSNGREFDTQYVIGVLKEKSLIKINNVKVTMHNLIQDMGREIVRRASPNPSNRSRLWCHKDILRVFEDNLGTDKIEALMLDLQENEKVQWNGNGLEKLTNLQILIIKNAKFSCPPKYLPNRLRVLMWPEYPSSYLPSNFQPRNLGMLKLDGSCLRSVTIKNFESLTQMVLRNCQFLEQVPDVSGALQLRIIDVKNCENLVKVHESVGFLPKLVELIVFGCTNLNSLPRSIKSASFKRLDLSNCYSLQSIPKIYGIEYNLKNPYFSEYNIRYRYRQMVLYKCDRELRLCCHISRWEHLNPWACQGKVGPAMPLVLTVYAESDFECINRYFSTWRPYGSSVAALFLELMHLTDEFLYQWLPWFPNLKCLVLYYIKFTILPECFNEHRYLETLILKRCEDLRDVKGVPQNIKFLMAVDCISLTPQSSGKLLNEAFHEDGGKFVIVPGFWIPHWFDHRCKGSSISFWFRNEFPRLALCHLSTSSHFSFKIFINGNRVPNSIHDLLPSAPFLYKAHKSRCISSLDLYEWGKKSKILPKKGEWNHVQFLYEDSPHCPPNIYGIGLHVYKKETGMDNVRFIDPNPLKRTWIINHNEDQITGFSLQNKFCPFLHMEVCDAINSRRRAESDFYHFLKNDNPSTSSFLRNFLVKKIRSMLNPTKVKFLMWKIVENSLPTFYNLFREKLVESPMCLICGTEMETIEHVFLECPWTQPIWFGSGLRWIYQGIQFGRDPIGFGSRLRWVYESIQFGRDLIHPYYDECWLERIFNGFMERAHPNAKSVIGLMGNISWAIWKARNEFVLRDKPVDPLEALMTAKAMQNGSLLQMGMRHNDPALEAYTGVTGPENVKGTVKYNVKRKRKNVISNNNIKMELTCDKGTEGENKAKRRRKRVGNKVETKVKQRRRRGVSNINSKKPNCDKVSKSTQLYKDPTSQEIDGNQNACILESQEEEANLVKNKGKIYTKRTTSEFDNILLEKLPKSAKSIHINLQKPYKQVIEAHEKFDVANFGTTKQEIQEEIATTRSQEPIDETTEDPINLKYGQEFKQMVMTIENQNLMNVVNDDFGLFENLEFVLSGSSPLSLKSISHIGPSSAIRQEEINKAIEGLGYFLNKNLEDIFNNVEERASFDNVLTFLETTSDKEIPIELKVFIVSLRELVAKILDQYSLCKINVKAFIDLEVEKQEIQQLGEVGKKEMKYINNEISTCKTVVESYNIEISSLEQQLSTLQQKLTDVKACHQTNVQKMSAFQAKNKSICEHAKNLLERGKKVMQSRVSLQSKCDEALQQQASLENEWTILKVAFLENNLKFKN